MTKAILTFVIIAALLMLGVYRKQAESTRAILIGPDKQAGRLWVRSFYDRAGNLQYECRTRTDLAVQTAPELSAPVWSVVKITPPAAVQLAIPPAASCEARANLSYR